jgi:hypothetical protein
MRANPASVNGALRSLVNTNGDFHGLDACSEGVIPRMYGNWAYNPLALPTGALFLGLEPANGLMAYPEQAADLCLALARLKALRGFINLILG